MISLTDLLHGRRRTLEAEHRRERVLSLPFAPKRLQRTDEPRVDAVERS
jgi:hypothetical protein